MRKQKRPSFRAFWEAVQNAPSFVTIAAWHREYIPINKLVEMERYYPDDEIERLMSLYPEKTPPIVVYPLETGEGTYGIIDGHHRFFYANKLGIPGLWAAVVDSVRS